MEKRVYEDFDGYDEMVKEIEVSRKYGVDHSAATHEADQYIRLLHPARLRLEVADIRDISPTTKLFRLVSRDRYLPPFQPGQYIALHVEGEGIRTARPYSICSSPNQTAFYEIAVRRIPGGLVSNHLLDRVERGMQLEASGPAGNFYFNPLFHDPTMVLVAGGSGVTPFRSMVLETLESALDRTIHLFYGSKTAEELLFHDEFLDLSDKHERFHYIPVLEEPPAGWTGAEGFIKGTTVLDAVGNVEGRTFYLCGPRAMYDFCIPELEALGVRRRKIRTEVYGAPLKVWETPGWPASVKPGDTFRVSLEGGGAFETRAAEPLLSAMERAGILVPSLCRSGECSMCRIRVVDGRVFQPPGVPVRKSDRRFGYVHSCVTYALEDLRIAF